MSSFYAPLGATGGATIGSLGGPMTAGGGALVGYGIGKGAQVLEENKELKENIQAITEGDVTKIAENMLDKELQKHEAKADNFFAMIKRILAICACVLACYLIVPYIIAKKTAQTCSQTESRRIKEEITRAPFPIKPPNEYQ